jgi:transcriptional regulator with XRE-family HTH domain
MNGLSYKITQNLSDKAILELIGRFIKKTRLRQGWSQDQVAQRAGMSRSTLSLLERGEPVTLLTLIQVLRILDCFYVLEHFAQADTISPIAYSRQVRKERQRARGKAEGSSMVNEDDLYEW